MSSGKDKAPAVRGPRGKEAERRAREAEALKRNLARRKSQTRARAGDVKGRRG